MRWCKRDHHKNKRKRAFFLKKEMKKWPRNHDKKASI
jgi:hypothetical protein